MEAPKRRAEDDAASGQAQQLVVKKQKLDVVVAGASSEGENGSKAIVHMTSKVGQVVRGWWGRSMPLLIALFVYFAAAAAAAAAAAGQGRAPYVQPRLSDHAADGP